MNEIMFVLAGEINNLGYTTNVADIAGTVVLEVTKDGHTSNFILMSGDGTTAEVLHQNQPRNRNFGEEEYIDFTDPASVDRVINLVKANWK